MKKLTSLLVVTFVLFAGTACSKGTDSNGKMITTKSGLKYIDTKIGAGETAVPGKQVKVHYTGWLSENGKKGKKFDSSVDRGVPFEFPLGAKRVIPGWEEGVQGMKVGGKRTLHVPSPLAYGGRAVGEVIPPNSNLIFDVELIGMN